MYFIGVDLGTSAVKLLLMEESGKICNIVSKEYPLFFPHPGWSEQNPEDWYTQSMVGMKELTEGIDRSQVAGISFGGQMHGLVTLDAEDQVIRPAILWNDGRSTAQTDYLNQTIGKQQLSEYTANIAFAGFTAPKILWMKENEPQNFARICKIMLPKDYLIYRLSGSFATDYSDASGMLLLDVKRRCWSQQMLSICGITEQQLPKLHESYEVVGTLLPQLAEQLGLPSSVRIVAGAGDNAAAAIGTGIGILPGLGGSTANVISYSVAKNSSKHPERFGTGIPEGVIASEASNNATIGGALIPLLTLGIPGDITTAILLGALSMKGITAGPLLFNTEGPMVYSIFIALLIANFVMVIMMFLGMRGFVKLLSTPKIYMLPIIMVMCLVGAFAVNNRMFDMWCVLGFGILGYVLKKADIPFAPLVMGFILGPIVELYLRRASMLNEGDLTPFFTRPIPAVFLAIAAAVIIMTIVKEIKARRRPKKAEA